jgi:transcriptional regulator with XRE-family HTH domain
LIYIQNNEVLFVEDAYDFGIILQKLRKEKGLTQEQLAEHVGVARRTISRWESGSNMPDLDIRVELSDFYDVDLRELLRGERRSEQMNKEMKDMVLQVADYSNGEKERLLRRMHWLFIAGLIGFITFLVITAAGLADTSPYEGIGSFGRGIAFGMIILGVIFTSRYAARIREFKKRLLARAEGKQ